jgi:hypothetical protein
MRKIPEHYENPIDNVLLHVCEYIMPSLKASRHTPNILTSYSLVAGLLSIYFLYYDSIRGFVISYWISYFFDCADGHMARKYNMCTRFGDLYDHFKDWSVGVVLSTIVYYKYYTYMSYVWYVLTFTMSMLMFLHVGSQQVHYANSSDNDETIDIFKKLCWDPNIISYTRIFGVGTFNLYMCASVWYFKYLAVVNIYKYI